MMIERGLADELASRVGSASVWQPDDRLDRIVVRASNPEQVAEALQVAAAAQLPIMPSGGGPPLDVFGLILDMSGLSAISEISNQDMLAVAQAGVTVASLGSSVDSKGLLFPPSLLAAPSTTVGGMLARGCGVRGPRYGPARDYVLGLKVALTNGKLVDVGSRAIKNATAYSLPQVLVGSRGTMGIIITATLRLLSRPAAVRSAVILFTSLEEAVRCALGLTVSASAPALVELLDCQSLTAGGLVDLLDSNGDSALLISLHAGDDAALTGQCERLTEALGSSGGGSRSVRFLDEGDSEAIWQARRQVPELLASGADGMTLLEVALPRRSIVSLVAYLSGLDIGGGRHPVLMGSVGSGGLLIALPPAEGPSPQPASGNTDSVRNICQAVLDAGGTLLDVCGSPLATATALGCSLHPMVEQTLDRVRRALDPSGLLSQSQRG